MAMNPFDHQTISLAFPCVTLGAMPSGSGGDASGSDAETRPALDAAETTGAYKAADAMNYDEVIDPRDLRNVLLEALNLAAGRNTGRGTPRPVGIRP